MYLIGQAGASPPLWHSWAALYIVRRRRTPATMRMRALRPNVKPARCKFKGRYLPADQWTVHLSPLAAWKRLIDNSAAPVLAIITSKSCHHLPFRVWAYTSWIPRETTITVCAHNVCHNSHSCTARGYRRTNALLPILMHKHTSLCWRAFPSLFTYNLFPLGSLPLAHNA